MSEAGVGPVETQFFTFGSPAEPFRLSSGATLDEVVVAYETYGELNADRSNAVLVFHALTGSQHAAGINTAVARIGERWTDENHVGWWDGYIGPGKGIDTDEYFVICANYLGGCYGSTGPASLDPSTGRPYASSFPTVSFADMVDAQLPLLESLGITKVRAVVGGSTGGFMAISLATRYPDMVDVVIPVAAGARATSLHRIHNLEQIAAIQNDPHFNGGDYYDGLPPNGGLALARMIQHKTFVSIAALKFRAREEVTASDGPGSYRLMHSVESYMWHQGRKFVDRFDANTYLRIIYAWQSVDLVNEAGVSGFRELFQASQRHRYLVFTIDSDVCFYPEEQDELLNYLASADVTYDHVLVHSDKGHDSFLTEPDLYAKHLAAALRG